MIRVLRYFTSLLRVFAPHPPSPLKNMLFRLVFLFLASFLPVAIAFKAVFRKAYENDDDDTSPKPFLTSPDRSEGFIKVSSLSVDPSCIMMPFCFTFFYFL